MTLRHILLSKIRPETDVNGTQERFWVDVGYTEAIQFDGLSPSRTGGAANSRETLVLYRMRPTVSVCR